MVRVVPVPTFDALIVVRKNPLKTLDVGRLNIFYKFRQVILIKDSKFSLIIALLPSLFPKLDIINTHVKMLLFFDFGHQLSIFLLVIA